MAGAVALQVANLIVAAVDEYNNNKEVGSRTGLADGELWMPGEQPPDQYQQYRADAWNGTTTTTTAMATATTAQMLMMNGNNGNHHSVDMAGNVDDVEVLPSVKALCWSCKVLAILIYSTLSVVAFAGNALILAVFLRFKRLRTPTNMLIANLAIGDLMISIFCIPLSYWHVLVFEDQRWVFGAFLCKTFNYLQATAVFLSSWTLVAISFDRFMAIQFAMSPWLKMDRQRALIAIIGTWAFSLGMALPLLIVNQLEHSADGVDTCLEKWADFFSDHFVSLYTSALFALQYCLPLAVLLITYTAIGCKMWNSKVPGDELCNRHQESKLLTTSTNGGGGILRNGNARGSTVSSCSQVVVGIGTGTTTTMAAANGTTTGSSSGISATMRRKSSHTNSAMVAHSNVHQERKESVKKLIPMVLLVSALYAVCWLPQNLLMNIWVTYDPTALNYPYILYIWWGAHTLAMSHSIVNPFVYYATNRRINGALNYLLRWLPCLRGSRHMAVADFDRMASRRRAPSTFRPPTTTGMVDHQQQTTMASSASGANNNQNHQRRRSTLQKTMSFSSESKS